MCKSISRIAYRDYIMIMYFILRLLNISSFQDLHNGLLLSIWILMSRYTLYRGLGGKLEIVQLRVVYTSAVQSTSLACQCSTFNLLKNVHK